MPTKRSRRKPESSAKRTKRAAGLRRPKDVKVGGQGSRAKAREWTPPPKARSGRHRRHLPTSTGFMDAVLETIAALVLVLDRDGRVVLCNKACEQVSGYSAADMNGEMIWEQLLLPEEKDAVQRVFAELRDGNCPNRYENHWRCRDGSLRLINWSNTCLRDDRGEVAYIIGTGIDVTDQRVAEEEVRRRQAELAHLHRVYTAGEFAAVMAHELNQPLAAIASYSEAGLQLLNQGEPDLERIFDKFEQIALQAQRAGQAIRELRRFLTRDEGQRRAPVELNALIRTVARLLGAEARASSVRIEFPPVTAPLTVLAESVHLEHVLVNLARNAIEAIRGAGKAAGTVTLSATTASAGRARVTVQDDGPGLDNESFERLFDRFHTTKPEGLGMGLVICRSIIEAHGGKIWAERPVNGGAVFHFTLPLKP